LESGILIIAHGSRVESARYIAAQVAEKIKKLKNTKNVKVAFMEFNQPDIPASIDEFVKEGILDIVAVPMFLFEGNHILHDIPEILKKKKERYPDLRILLAKPIGYDDRLVEIIIERAEEARRYSASN